MIKKPDFSNLEIVKNEYCDRDYDIKISIPEFSCVCPKTSLPDFATIKINYIGITKKHNSHASRSKC